MCEHHDHCNCGNHQNLEPDMNSVMLNNAIIAYNNAMNMLQNGADPKTVEPLINAALQTIRAMPAMEVLNNAKE